MKKKRRNTLSVLKRIFIKVLGGTLIIAIPYFLLLYFFPLESITVHGTERIAQDRIKEEILKTRFRSNTLLLYLNYKYINEIHIPFVEKIDLEMVDFHTIDVYVYEKKIVGCVEFLGEYLYFDKDGIVVESSSRKLDDIPQVTGLIFNRVILNEKLEVNDTIKSSNTLASSANSEKDKETNRLGDSELFNTILNLTQLNEKYELGVDIISFNSRKEVTIYCGNTKVLLGRKSTYDEALSELKNILKKSEDMKLTIDMRDYRKGMGSIVAKPEKSSD